MRDSWLIGSLTGAVVFEIVAKYIHRDQTKIYPCLLFKYFYFILSETFGYLAVVICWDYTKKFIAVLPAH
jgi:hypothetical protein